MRLPGRETNWADGVQPLVDALSQLRQASPRSADATDRAGSGRFTADGDGSSQSVRVLRTSRPVAAGDVTRLSLHLENDDDQPDECTLYVTDLDWPFRGSGSRRRTCVCHRTPPAFPAAGRPTSRLRCEFRATLPTGWYTGLLQTDDGEALRALVQVRVGQ